MASFWIFPTYADSWELVKAHKVYAFDREVYRDRIKPGDKTIFYLIRSNPPVFVGAYEVAKPWEEAKEPFWPTEKVEGRVIWRWRFELTPLRLGAVDVRRLSRQLSFIENKEAWSAYFVGAVANFGRPINESDYLCIFDELAKPPVAYQVKPHIKPERPPVMKIRMRKKLPRLRNKM